MTRPVILLTGARGQTGWELARSLACLGEVVAPARSQLDVADLPVLRETVRALRPRLIVNAAAWTQVDDAEASPEAARALNAHAPAVLAEEARRGGALLAHYSTDYVYDGHGLRPWREDAAASPLNVYGRTKLEGDEAILASGCRHLILRTSWVYGARGRNFLTTMQRLLPEREELRIVADQIGAPTWSRHLADATAQMLGQVHSPARGADRPEPWGVYHMVNAGETSWHGFAAAIRKRMTASPMAQLIPIPASAYPTAARRPQNSRLDCDKLERVFGLRLPPWEEALEACLAAASDG
ncbi:MAG: dTDP-4-dehydrorhamnose reductase [Betaproteobacteria bacterium]|nr:dTDP-4-dehydrorhamnose reductase [Betaproteobacteria bacterium]